MIPQQISKLHTSWGVGTVHTEALDQGQQLTHDTAHDVLSFLGGGEQGRSVPSAAIHLHTPDMGPDDQIHCAMGPWHMLQAPALNPPEQKTTGTLVPAAESRPWMMRLQQHLAVLEAPAFDVRQAAASFDVHLTPNRPRRGRLALVTQGPPAQPALAVLHISEGPVRDMCA